MKEFMLLIRNEVDAKATLTPEKHQQFLQACMVYIEKLRKNGNLISAQPLVRDGRMISGVPGRFNEGIYNEGREIIVGYYHILAENLDEATMIAKENPEFDFTQTAKIEIRPVKMMEETTTYIYPSGEIAHSL